VLSIDRRRTYDFLLPSFIREGRAAETPTALFEAFDLLRYPLNVLETKFVLDNLHVAHGVNVSLHMDNLGIVESANDLKDAVDRTYVRKESISEPGTCRCALDSISLLRHGEFPIIRLLTAVRPAISMQVKCAGTREAGL
jgi:hypothetical protein